MMRSAVLIQYTRVTDGRTDGIGVTYTRYSIYAVARKNVRVVCLSVCHSLWGLLCCTVVWPYINTSLTLTLTLRNGEMGNGEVDPHLTLLNTATNILHCAVINALEVWLFSDRFIVNLLSKNIPNLKAVDELMKIGCLLFSVVHRSVTNYL